MGSLSFALRRETLIYLTFSILIVAPRVFNYPQNTHLSPLKISCQSQKKVMPKFVAHRFFRRSLKRPFSLYYRCNLYRPFSSFCSHFALFSPCPFISFLLFREIISQIQFTPIIFFLLTSSFIYNTLSMAGPVPLIHPQLHSRTGPSFLSEEVINLRLHRPVDPQCVKTLGFGPYPQELITLTGRPFHYGIDFAPPDSLKKDTFKIFAAADGTVLHTGFNLKAGFFIILSHISPQNLLLTYYLHLDKIWTFRGANILQGDIIADMGNTGLSTNKHCHFALAILYLESLNFIDPAPHFIQ